MSESNQSRTPAGVPTGGQFAASAKSEADVSLTSEAPAPQVLTAPPSTNPAAAPFGRAATLEALNDHFQGLSSPENISWDGERSGAQVQADLKRLQSAYWVRRDEIDPTRERAWCIACRIEVPGTDGQPNSHDNDLGRPCWVGGR